MRCPISPLSPLFTDNVGAESKHGWRIYSIGEVVALTEQRILLSQQRRAAATTFGGEFSNFTRSYAGKGVVRYQW